MRAIMPLPRRILTTRHLVFAILAASIISAPLLAQQQPAVTADDYARAERFLAPAVTPLVSGGAVAESSSATGTCG